MGNLKKPKMSEWAESVTGGKKKKKGNTAILCSSLCCLRGAEQGNRETESILVEKR